MLLNWGNRFYCQFSLTAGAKISNSSLTNRIVKEYVKFGNLFGLIEYLILFTFLFLMCPS